MAHLVRCDLAHQPSFQIEIERELSCIRIDGRRTHEVLGMPVGIAVFRPCDGAVCYGHDVALEDMHRERVDDTTVHPLLRVADQDRMEDVEPEIEIGGASWRGTGG